MISVCLYMLLARSLELNWMLSGALILGSFLAIPFAGLLLVKLQRNVIRLLIAAGNLILGILLISNYLLA